MPNIERRFSGKMNLDDSPLVMPMQDYIDANCITRDSTGLSKDGIVSSISGNDSKAFSYPAGTNVCIGAKEDSKRNRVIYFVYNSDGKHSIMYWSVGQPFPVKIFQSKNDSDNVDILRLSLLYKVNDIDIIYTDNGDLLLWNDAHERPGQLNIDDFLANQYPNATEDLIRLHRTPPLDELVPQYLTDTTSKVNNLKKKLYQFSYAWGYLNGEISTLAPPSKVAIPIDAYNVDSESDPSKNNAIQLQLTGGPRDYKYIRVFGRESTAANIWSDWFIIDTLDSADYNIPPFGTYIFKFLNDAKYLTADQAYTDLNWDRIADVCNAQAVVDGNIITQSGITEGYNPVMRSDVNVSITTAYKETAAPIVAPATPMLTKTVGISGNAYYASFTVGPSVGSGTTYKIKLTWAVYSGSDLTVDVTYTTPSDMTPNAVAVAIVALIATQATGKPFNVSVVLTNRINIQDQQQRPNGYDPKNIVFSAVPQVLQSGGSPTWPWNIKGRLGLVYTDGYGKSNGTVSFVSSTDDPNDFSFTTGDFDVNLSNGNIKVPVVNAAINHLPPSWAKAFYWVRTPNDGYFLEYITAEIQDDTQYYYFCIENLDIFREQNTGFVPSYVFESGDRMRILAGVVEGTPFYDLTIRGLDYEILGTVERDMTTAPAGGTPTTAGTYLKIRKPSTAPTYTGRIMIQIYRPQLRQADTTQLFYSFGESYPIYTLNGVNYHTGQDQNQTASGPATFKFLDGDVYFKYRDFYRLKDDGTIDIETPYSRAVMDANYSDYFNSAISSNGAPWAIDPNAKRLTLPEVIRFSLAYEPGTDLNGINRFYPANSISVIRDFGDIKRTIVWNNDLIVFQQRKIGRVGVRRQIWFDAKGNSTAAISDQLLNRIEYYNGQYGVGDAPESIAWNNKAIYGWDTLRGVCWRISQNGLEAISIVHKINGFAFVESRKRGFASKIYGGFDPASNNYLSVFEASGSSASKMLAWSEDDNGFECWLPYRPEMMCSINGLFVSFKDGTIYSHDSVAYNRFYNVAYDSDITGVFNDDSKVKKSFSSVSTVSDSAWDVVSIITDVNANPTGVKQQTAITAEAFEDQEAEFHADIPPNAVAPDDGVVGQPMKGHYAIVKFRKKTPDKFVFLSHTIISVQQSVKNPR